MMFDVCLGILVISWNVQMWKALHVRDFKVLKMFLCCCS